MADTNTAATPKKRKSFTRTQKPLFAVVNYTGTDSAGQPVKLSKADLSIVLHRDAAAILEAVEGGSMGDGIFMKVELPSAAAKPAATPAA